MIRRPLRAALLGSALLALPLPVSVTPAQAQWTVFDPWNYAQNILSAARALDQINNQIASLQNEAQMLINQARNLASLPYSSLMRLQQSFARSRADIRRRVTGSAPSAHAPAPGLEKVESFGAAHLAVRDAVGAHPKCAADEFGERDDAVLRAQRDQVGCAALEFASVLDQHDTPTLARHLSKQGVGKGGLAGRGTTSH